MTEFRADLHCHTTCSDGSLSPQEIIRLASSIGLKGLSITDHDSIDAYDTALPVAKELSIEMIPGVEFSANHRNISVHILGYAFSLDNENIRLFCQRHQQRREKRNRAILELLAKHGMPITEDELLASVMEFAPLMHKSIGRPHIAQAMIHKGYVESVYEAFAKYLKEGKPCYAAGDIFTVEETINVIHQAKGLAIIAHPHLIENAGLLHQLLEMNFDGLEGYYARFPILQEERWIKIAQKKGWLITGGSDFHGVVKPTIPLGCSWVNEAVFRQMQNHYHQT